MIIIDSKDPIDHSIEAMLSRLLIRYRTRVDQSHNNNSSRLMRILSVVLQLKEEDHLKVLAWLKEWVGVGHLEEVVEQGQECQ